MTPDYYAVLGVHPYASGPTIDKRFRSLAIAVNASLRRGDPEAESRLRELVAAHATLKDAGARAWYDRHLELQVPGPQAADGRPEVGVPEASWQLGPEVLERKMKQARRIMVPWTAWDVFAIVGLVIGVYILVSVVLATAVGLATAVDANVDIRQMLKSPLANSLMWLTQWCLTLGVTFTYLKLRGYQLDTNTLGFRRTRLFRAAGLVAAVLIVAFVIQAIYVQFVLPQQEQVTDMFGTGIPSFLLAMTIVAILTPVVEEMFFRGIIHQGLQQQFGFLPGALISATIFMLAHISYTVFVPIFCLGFGFAILVSRTRSVWPSIVAHFLWNSLGVAASFFAPDS